MLKDFLPSLPSFCDLIMHQLSDLHELTIIPSQEDNDDMTDQIILQEVCNKMNHCKFIVCILFRT